MDVVKEDPCLCRAAIRYAGGWPAAMRELGCDYPPLRAGRPIWSAERVIRGILDRERRGLPLAAGAVHREDGELRRAADRRFGNWSEALRRSGIDPNTIPNLRRWTASAVVSQIHRLDLQADPLHLSAVSRRDGGLVGAALVRFGSWDSALRAAGCDPAAIRRIRPAWTRATIVQVIQRRAAAGLSVASGKMRPHSARMAALRIFGSWDAALRAAGARDLVPQRRRWSPEAVVERIRRYHQEGRPLNFGAVRRENGPLVVAARQHFGQWDLALHAAGLDPSRIRRRCPEWTRVGVLEAIRERAAAGLPLRGKAIKPKSLMASARRFFGSWPKALEAAGVAPSQPPPAQRPSRRRRRGAGRKSCANDR